jgi:MFS family permease
VLTTLRNRNLALLAAGGLVSSVGDWLLIIALPFAVYQLTRSTVATGTMFLVQIVTSSLLAPVAGTLVDRWDRRRTMLIADLARAVLLLPLLAFHSECDLPLLYGVAFGQSLVGSVFGPAKSALIPRLVHAQNLTATNALLGVGDELAMLVGAPLGGAIFAVVGLTGTTLLDSGTFLVSALLITFVRPPAMSPGVVATTDEEARVWRKTLRGIGSVGQIPTLRGVILSEGTGMVGQGMIQVLWVVFFQSVLHGDVLAYGTIQTAVGVGTVVGGVLAGWLGGRMLTRAVIGLSGIAVGVGLLGTFDLPQLLHATTLDLGTYVVIVGLQTLMGLPAMWRAVATRTLVQQNAGDALRGRAFGLLGSVSSLALALGVSLASTLGTVLSVTALLNVAALLFAASGVVALVMLPSTAQQSSVTLGEALIDQD